MSETNRKRPLLGTCLCAKQSAIGSQTRSFSQQTVIAQLVVAQRVGVQGIRPHPW